MPHNRDAEVALERREVCPLVREGELEEGAEAGLRSMQEGAEDISADDYATRELTRLRKETMDTMKRKKDE